MTDVDGGGESLVERVLGGRNRGLQVFAAEGVLPVDPAELVALQAVLAASDDVEIADKASQSLRDTDPRFLAEIVAEAGEPLLRALCERVPHPVVLEAVLRRRSLGCDLMCDLAASISADLQAVLLQRQSDIRRHPEILAALENNPAISSTSKRLIAEYRQHLLVGDMKLTLPQVTEGEPQEEGPDEEVVAAIKKAAVEVPAAGEVDEQTGLTEDQIRSLPVGVRVKLGHGASMKLRNLLVRDNVPQVAVSALTHSAITEIEVERLCKSYSVVQEVLVEVSRNRTWMARYSILSSLVQNPKTPDGLALRLLPRLAVRDLATLTRSHGVSQSVRSLARQIYRQKRS